MAKNKNKKNYQVQKEQMEKEKKYYNGLKKLRYFPVIAFVLALVVFLMFFMDWSYIYNSDPSIGTEAGITGFNCLAAGTSGNYSGTNSSIGKFMAAPFYLYAKNYVVSLSAVTVAAFFVLLAEIICFILAAITNKEGLNIAGLVIGVAVTVLLFICYSSGLAVTKGTILIDYCKNNPKCSIRSNAILPALISLFSLAAPTWEIIRRALLKKQLKKGK